MVTAVPESELMAGAVQLIERSAMATVLVLLLTIPFTWWLALSISRSLTGLAREADKIRHFDFSEAIAANSAIKEVNQLAKTMEAMKLRIRRFLDISHAVAAEQNFDRLLPQLLAETLSASQARAGILYLADRTQLKPAAALTQTGSELGSALPTIDVLSAGPLLGAALADGVARAGCLQSDDTAALGGCSAGLADASNAIAVPLLNGKAELVGAMLLLCDTGSDDARLSFVKAFAGSAAVSLESKALIKAQKDLFEAFIQLIAAAIDAKSPYTGGHCARVPELTKMLARAACADDGDAYRDFHLSDDDWEALHVAAWLHDCGRSTMTLPSSPAVTRVASSWPRKGSPAWRPSRRAPGCVRWMIDSAFPTQSNSARQEPPPPFCRSPKPCSPTSRSTSSRDDRRIDCRTISPGDFAWPSLPCSITAASSTTSPSNGERCRKRNATRSTSISFRP
jgi:hypothetical protein